MPSFTSETAYAGGGDIACVTMCTTHISTLGCEGAGDNIYMHTYIHNSTCRYAQRQAKQGNARKATTPNPKATPTRPQSIEQAVGRVFSLDLRVSMVIDDNEPSGRRVCRVVRTLVLGFRCVWKWDWDWDFAPNSGRNRNA